jgi:hypothetical protein
MRDDHVDRRGRWKVTEKVWVTENVGTALGQVRGEVAWGDDVGVEERPTVGGMGTICLDGGER